MQQADLWRFPSCGQEPVRHLTDPPIRQPHDPQHLAWLLADLPVVLVGRLRSERVFYAPAGARKGHTKGRLPKHDPTGAGRSGNAPEPTNATVNGTSRGGPMPLPSHGCATGSSLTAPGGTIRVFFAGHRRHRRQPQEWSGCPGAFAQTDVAVDLQADPGQGRGGGSLVVDVHSELPVSVGVAGLGLATPTHTGGSFVVSPSSTPSTS